MYFYPPPLRRSSSAGASAESLTVIRTAYRKLVWRRANWRQRITLVLAVLTWPILAAIQALHLTCKLGGRVKAETGRGRAEQFIDQTRLAWRDLIPPRNYYMFELYLDAHRARAAQYLLRVETKGGVFFLLRPRDFQPGRRRPFRDKVEFAAECHAAGLRAAPVLARFERGAEMPSEDTQALPPVDLFVKPIAGKGGRGAERWRYREGRWQNGAQSFDEAGLRANLASRSRKVGLLLQPRLTNHPDFDEINAGALSTFRLVTALDEREQPELIGVVLRMPSRSGSAVDNFHAGGIAAPVDLATGRLGAASDMGLKSTTRWHAVHPVTGGKIEGRIVPYWAEVKTLVIDAHAKLGERVVIGWDVAVLADGPTIVEANGLPDQDILQRIHKAPLGQARLGQLLAYHLTHGTKWRKP